MDEMYCMVFDGIAGYYIVFDGIQWYSLELYGIQLYCRLLRDILWYSMVFGVCLVKEHLTDNHCYEN